MEQVDARSLSAETQEALRTRAVQAVLDGILQHEAADRFGVARGTVVRWMKQYRAHGAPGLERKPQGRPPAPRLKGHQAATIVRLMTERCPNQLKFPFALWTREVVGLLIQRRFGIRVSVWTVGRYVRRWGLTPHVAHHVQLLTHFRLQGIPSE